MKNSWSGRRSLSLQASPAPRGTDSWAQCSQGAANILGRGEVAEKLWKPVSRGPGRSVNWLLAGSPSQVADVCAGGGRRALLQIFLHIFTLALLVPFLCSFWEKSSPGQHKVYVTLKSHSLPLLNTFVDAMMFWHKQTVVGVKAPFLTSSWLDGYLYGQGDLNFFKALTP